MVFPLNRRGVLKKTRGVTIKGPQADNDHDDRTVFALQCLSSSEPPLPFHDCVCVGGGVKGEGALHFRGNSYHIRKAPLNLLPNHLAGCLLWGGPGPGKALQLVHVAREVALPLGPDTHWQFQWCSKYRWQIHCVPASVTGEISRGLEQSHPCSNTIGPA